MTYGSAGIASLSAAFALMLAGPAAAQQGYGPNAAVSGHYHEGELGEKYLIIEGSLKCSCGCGLDVHSCQFQMQCETSPGWSQRVRQELEAGTEPDVILAGFVDDYGTQVLMAPPAEGFNLLGYLLPAFAIVTAGMLVGLIARGGNRAPELAPIAQLSDEESERLRAAMQKLDEAEGPDW